MDANSSDEVFLLTALHLAEVAQRHRGSGGHLAQRATLGLALLAEHVAQFTTEQDHGALLCSDRTGVGTHVTARP